MVFTKSDDSKNENSFKFNSKPNSNLKRKNGERYADRLYELAAKAVRDTKENTVGFKNVFSKMHLDKKFMKPVFGIGCKVVSKWRINEELLKSSGILTEHPDLDKNLLRVVITELLWGHKKTNGKGKVFDIVREKQEILTDLLKEHEEEVKEKELEVFFARVNAFKGSVRVVLTQLDELGFELVETPSKYKKFLQEIVKLEPNSFMIDFHFKDLLVFSAKAKATLIPDAMVQDKFIVIQNKSSLIPVHLMDVKPGNTVLDMCAAPGMKTAIIASQLNGEGKVWAVDKDGSRYKSMIKNLNNFGAQKMSHTMNCDVLHLKCNPEDFDLILLDAPCSGSGIAGRLGETDADAPRLRKLQWVQMKLLTHALTKYPNAKRVVYSTCSIHADENEGVIDEVMERLKDELTYKLVDCHELISGFSKGLKEYKCGSSCIRVSVEKDFTNGFFVAVFDKDMTKIKTEDVKSTEKKKVKKRNKRKHSEVKEEVASDGENEEEEEDADSVVNSEDEGEEVPQPQTKAKQKKAKQIETPPKKMKLLDETSNKTTGQKKNKKKPSKVKEGEEEDADSIVNTEDEEEEIPQPQTIAKQKKAKQIETPPKKMKLLDKTSNKTTVQKKNKKKPSKVKEEEEEDADSVVNTEDEEEEIPQPQNIAKQKKAKQIETPSKKIQLLDETSNKTTTQKKNKKKQSKAKKEVACEEEEDNVNTEDKEEVLPQPHTNKKGKKAKQNETPSKKVKLQDETPNKTTVQKKNKRKHSEVKEEVGSEEEEDNAVSAVLAEDKEEEIPQPQTVVRKKKGKKSKNTETTPQNKNTGKKAKKENVPNQESVVDKSFGETPNKPVGKSKKNKQKKSFKKTAVC